MTSTFSRFSRAFLLSCVAGSTLIACQPKVAGPIDFAHQSSDLKPDENVMYGKLANGVRYAVMQNDTPSKTASIRMRINSGSLNDADGTQGLAHFLEHMAFNGSKNVPEGEMVKRLERYGIAFGADSNAYTIFDETVYQMDLPEVTEELFDVTLEIMRETAENLLLDQEAIDRERGVVQSEKRNRESPGYRAQMANWNFFVGESNVIKQLPIGTDEALASINKADFERYYNGYYRPEDAFVVIVGDVDPAFAASKIDQWFSGWEGKGEALPDLGAGEALKTGLAAGYFTDPDVSTSLEVSVMRKHEDIPDTAANRRASMIDSLGNAILNRRLSTITLSEASPFISAGASTYDFYKAADFSTINISSQADKWDESLATVEQEVRRAIEHGFTQSELKEQVANLRKGLQVSVQTASTRRTPSLADGIAAGFNSQTVFTTPQSGLERFESYIGDVTTDEIWDAFKKNWAGFDAPLIFLTTPDVIENPEEVIKAAFTASQAVPVEAPIEAADTAFAYTDFGTPGDIVFQDIIEDLDIHRVKFANNVMLNIKKTDFQKDNISISVKMDGGFLSLPKDNPHVQQLGSYAVTAGGLEAHSADEISRIMAGKTVGASFSAGTEAFFMSGRTVPGDLADQLNLMMGYMTAPGYRAEAESRYDNYIESWYPTLDSTPGGVAQRDLARLVRSGDKRFGLPTQAEFLAPTLDDVKNWVTPGLTTGRMEIGIVGDVDIDAVIAEIARTFGALPTRNDTTPDYNEGRQLTFPKALRNPITLSHEGEQNRAIVAVYWPAPDGTDTLRSRRMNMLRRVFSNRLLEVIREEEGAAYSPRGAAYNPENYPGYGYFSTALDIDPKDADRMFVVAAQIADDFKAGNISEDEFDRAKKPVLEQIETSLESNGYWMSVISDAQTEDKLDEARTRSQVYTDMTLADIKPLAAQIFDNDKAYKVQILPQQ